jgi:hypothetical protein
MPAGYNFWLIPLRLSWVVSYLCKGLKAPCAGTFFQWTSSPELNLSQPPRLHPRFSSGGHSGSRCFRSAKLPLLTSIARPSAIRSQARFDERDLCGGAGWGAICRRSSGETPVATQRSPSPIPRESLPPYSPEDWRAASHCLLLWLFMRCPENTVKSGGARGDITMASPHVAAVLICSAKIAGEGRANHDARRNAHALH